ncbi:MAG: glycosyltransferase family 9 protein [Planctomycetaceae bacterium]|jgi:ADP-heptose:LPS heptosyltransferase|nr:glycosyltransferase family 9 protein [Planctomycetaceae bacterium]
MLFNLLHKSSLLYGKPFLPKELANPRRILVTHFGSTVEIIRSVPVLVTLRHRFPHAEIAWLVEENAAPLLLDHWAVNRFIVVRHQWLQHLSEIRRVRQRLQSFAPQVAVDPQGSFSSALATLLSGATYRIGFGGKQSRFLHNLRVVSKESHQIERNLQLLQPFGIFGSGIGFDMPECEKDRLIARNILHRKGLTGNFALINVSAACPEERWDEERYGMVAKYLYDQWNLPSLIVWSGFEQELRRAETAVHAALGAAYQAPRTTQPERRSLAKSATIVIGSDVAELQIAAAVGTACVGLFGPAPAQENAPFGQEHRIVQAQQPEIRRKRRKRTSLIRAMDTIPPEWVYEMCDDVLLEISPPSILPSQQESTEKRKAA